MRARACAALFMCVHSRLARASAPHPHALPLPLATQFHALWAGPASIVFMGEMVSPNRKLLAVFPVCLFYMVVSWMVFMV